MTSAFSILMPGTRAHAHSQGEGCVDSSQEGNSLGEYHDSEGRVPHSNSGQPETPEDDCELNTGEGDAEETLFQQQETLLTVLAHGEITGCQSETDTIEVSHSDEASQLSIQGEGGDELAEAPGVFEESEDQDISEEAEKETMQESEGEDIEDSFEAQHHHEQYRIEQFSFPASSLPSKPAARSGSQADHGVEESMLDESGSSGDLLVSVLDDSGRMQPRKRSLKDGVASFLDQIRNFSKDHLRSTVRRLSGSDKGVSEPSRSSKAVKDPTANGQPRRQLNVAALAGLQAGNAAGR
eukprot:765255-Hanusia_phi.AAC.1